MNAMKFHEFVLADINIFSDCSEQFLQDVFPLFEKVNLLPWEILKTTGSVCKYIWVVVTGNVYIVDGNDNVLNKNDVVGIYQQIYDQSIHIYTAYATQQGAVCMRISQEYLKAMFTKYPQDKEIIMRKGLKYINRIPQGHIMTAMKMQVSHGGKHLTDMFSHRRKLKRSKSLPLFFLVQ